MIPKWHLIVWLALSGLCWAMIGLLIWLVLR